MPIPTSQLISQANIKSAYVYTSSWTFCAKAFLRYITLEDANMKDISLFIITRYHQMALKVVPVDTLTGNIGVFIF